MQFSQAIFDQASVLKRFANNATLAKNIIQILIDELPEHSQRFAQLYAQKDYLELALAVHKLHGGAAYAGTLRLQAVCKSFELALRQGEVSAHDEILYDQYMTILTETISASQQALVSFLQTN